MSRRHREMLGAARTIQGEIGADRLCTYLHQHPILFRSFDGHFVARSMARVEEMAASWLAVSREDPVGSWKLVCLVRVASPSRSLTACHPWKVHKEGCVDGYLTRCRPGLLLFSGTTESAQIQCVVVCHPQRRGKVQYIHGRRCDYRCSKHGGFLARFWSGVAAYLCSSVDPETSQVPRFVTFMDGKGRKQDVCKQPDEKSKRRRACFRQNTHRGRPAEDVCLSVTSHRIDASMLIQCLHLGGL